MKDRKKINIRDAVKIGASIEGMNLKEVAKASGRQQSTLSTILRRGKPNLSVINEILKVLGAVIIIEYSNEMQVEIEFEDE